MKKKPNKAEREYLSRVAQLPCMVNNSDCSPGVEIHHKLSGGVRASHYDTMPLCFNHHSAQTPLAFGESIHKGTKSFEAKYGTQDEMLERVKLLLEMLNEGT